MLYGMGTVFVFLTLLVLCTLVMSRLLAFLPAEQVIENKPKAPIAPAPAADPRLIAIIESAIAKHRNR